MPSTISRQLVQHTAVAQHNAEHTMNQVPYIPSSVTPQQIPQVVAGTTNSSRYDRCQTEVGTMQQQQQRIPRGTVIRSRSRCHAAVGPLHKSSRCYNRGRIRCIILSRKKRKETREEDTRKYFQQRQKTATKPNERNDAD